MIYLIEFKNVSKIYANNKSVVNNISLKFETGEFICFIGSSGSGKTTCMRMINRMNVPTTGDIFINERNIKNMNPVELRRHIGYVIQQIGLMPHMSVYENIVMVPRLLKWSEDKMQETAKKLIKKVDLPESFLDRYPAELSGGQQQRIGVIRALAANQDIILMDEPFGALDPITRASLQHLLKKLQKEMGYSIIFVTHDMDEALQLADKIVIMDKGDLIQFDTPTNILLNPANDFVKNMIGEERLHQAVFDNQTVRTIMIDNPVTITYSCKLNKALQLMQNRRVDSLFVTDEKNVLLGVIDIFHIQGGKKVNATVADFMKETTYMHEDTIIRDAIFYINELGYRNIPVVNQSNEMVGLITRASIVDVMCSGLWSDYELVDEDKEMAISTTDLTHFEELN